jgi:citrate lyase subunit beta/citryl-CoA lyase
VLAALEANPRGAISVDGKLVDKPIVDRARRIQAA